MNSLLVAALNAKTYPFFDLLPKAVTNNADHPASQ